MIGSIVSMLAGSIGSQVLVYLKDNKALAQFERMQAEILEGWAFKIQIAIREEHRRLGISHEDHVKVMEQVQKIIKEEFDTRDL